MGMCASKDVLSPDERAGLKDAQARTQLIERQLQRDHLGDSQIHKLLLLGAGESGKSTLFKQMIQIYGKGFSEKERRTYVSIIHSNVIASIKTLCEQTDVLADHHGEATRVAPHLETSKATIAELKINDVITPEIAGHIKALWHDPGSQRTYELRNRYQLNDSAAYFFDQIVLIADPNYLPSEQDVLRSRVRTTGIVENNFMVEGNNFKMFDVGGQRNERKKWIHCFQDVTAVLFVAALSEYDMMLFEDTTVNRMDEALNLFDEICNSQWFRKTAMILMLNKRDLFAEKISKIPLTVWDETYDGLSSYDEGCAFIEHKFLQRNHSLTKVVYTHVTCATDTENMRVVFNAVKDIVIRKSLQEGGLLA